MHDNFHCNTAKLPDIGQADYGKVFFDQLGLEVLTEIPENFEQT